MLHLKHLDTKISVALHNLNKPPKILLIFSLQLRSLNLFCKNKKSPQIGTIINAKSFSLISIAHSTTIIENEKSYTLERSVANEAQSRLLDCKNKKIKLKN